MPSSPSAPSVSFSSVSSSSSSFSQFISASSSLHERFSSARMSIGEDGELDDQRPKKVSGGGIFQWCNKIGLVKQTLLMIIGRRSG